MTKTGLTQEVVEQFLRRETSGSAGSVQQLVEGEESQAFSFSQAGQSYVIRINRSAAGFHKDAYAWQHFSSSAIPIPAVHRIGQLDAAHAFCLSDLAPGTTLQDLPATDLQASLGPTFELWLAMGRVEVAATTGWGDFDHLGRGQFASWRAYLRASLDPRRHSWEGLRLAPDQDLVRRLAAAFEARLPQCPEIRQLVHGDFGSNNVLAEAGRITAVLDWDNAKYGDPLFDVAGAYYWRTWLVCMEAFAAYCEPRLQALPGYAERIAAYQLRVGLEEIRLHAAEGHPAELAWHQRRCAALLGEL